MIVLGSRNSSNSQRLAEISHQLECPAYLIDGVHELNDGWFAGGADCSRDGRRELPRTSWKRRSPTCASGLAQPSNRA